MNSIKAIAIIVHWQPKGKNPSYRLSSSWMRMRFMVILIMMPKAQKPPKNHPSFLIFGFYQALLSSFLPYQ
jgi:hypothetical protein